MEKLKEAELKSEYRCQNIQNEINSLQRQIKEREIDANKRIEIIKKETEQKVKEKKDNYNKELEKLDEQIKIKIENMKREYQKRINEENNRINRILNQYHNDIVYLLMYF